MDVNKLGEKLKEIQQKGYFSSGVEEMKSQVLYDFLNVNNKLDELIPSKISLFDIDLLALILQNSDYHSFLGDLFEDVDFSIGSKDIDENLELYL